jgi:L-xylulokinase
MRFLLIGEFQTEITETSGWSLMDLMTKDYDDELFAAVGLSDYRHLFPRIIESSEIGGHVTKEAAIATGLAEGTPVMGGMFDISACPLGTGVSDSSRMSIVAGTWSINGYVDKKPSKEIMMSTLYFTPGDFLVSENSATSATNLEWFINRFMQREKAEAKEKGQNIYDTVNEMVASVDTRDCPIIFLPFLFGSNANIDAKSLFIGLSGIHTKAHMLRAVYEGIVFSHQYHFEKLYKTKPKSTFEAVRISGGVTKSELWTQMFADIIGLPMEVSYASELGILGCVMCAGIGAGHFKDADDAAAVFVSIEKTVYPNEEMTVFYQKKYSLYKRILDSLDTVWPDFDGLTSEDK